MGSITSNIINYGLTNEEIEIKNILPSEISSSYLEDSLDCSIASLAKEVIVNEQKVEQTLHPNSLERPIKKRGFKKVRGLFSIPLNLCEKVKKRDRGKGTTKRKKRNTDKGTRSRKTTTTKERITLFGKFAK